jgi:hypothetical protein
MINVRNTLGAHFQESYLNQITASKAQGTSTEYQAEIEEDLLNFLDAIPGYIEIEDGQYAMIERWIDMEIMNDSYLSQSGEIAILTYINSCYASRYTKETTQE